MSETLSSEKTTDNSDSNVMQTESTRKTEDTSLRQCEKSDDASGAIEDNVESESEESSFEESIHPISKCLSRFMHSIYDIEDASREFIPLAIERHNSVVESIKRDFEEGERLQQDSDPRNVALSSAMFLKLHTKAQRLRNANVPEAIEKALFLNIFSEFDTFTGELLTTLHLLKPALYNGISKSIAFKDVLQFSSFDEIKKQILTDDIESFRRKSYVEQFKELENRFRINLRKFDNWPIFVEMAQRRNLFMHCDGIVSEQYLSVCKENNYKCKNMPEVGDKLELEYKYLEQCWYVILEVAIKLTHVIWRAVYKEDIDKADEELNNIVYQSLFEQRYKLANTIGKFMKENAQPQREVLAKMNIVNIAIATKALHPNKNAHIKVLDEVDWAVTGLDFRLANAILREEFEEAAELMNRIGPTGDFIGEDSYHTWPLFNDSRQAPEFLEAYEAVYGYSFITKAHEEASDINDEFKNVVDEDSETGNSESEK